MAEAGFMEETGRDNMFRTRLLSGIVLVILALILLITGGNVLGGFFTCDFDHRTA